MSGEIRGQLNELPDTATAGSELANRSTGPSVPAILFALFGFASLVIGLRRFMLSCV